MDEKCVDRARLQWIQGFSVNKVTMNKGSQSHCTTKLQWTRGPNLTAQQSYNEQGVPILLHNKVTMNKGPQSHCTTKLQWTRGPNLTAQQSYNEQGAPISPHNKVTMNKGSQSHCTTKLQWTRAPNLTAQTTKGSSHTNIASLVLQSVRHSILTSVTEQGGQSHQRGPVLLALQCLRKGFSRSHSNGLLHQKQHHGHGIYTVS